MVQRVMTRVNENHGERGNEAQGDGGDDDDRFRFPLPEKRIPALAAAWH